MVLLCPARPRTLVFLRLMVSPKSLTGLREAVHQRTKFLPGVGRNCCVISKQHIPDENIALFCLGSESGEVEDRACHLIWHECRVIVYVVVSKACFSSVLKKIPKRVEARSQPCLTPLQISIGSDELPLNCTVALVSVWKDTILLCSLGGQSIFGRTRAVSLTR